MRTNPACAFARNALLGHLLSKGDFGVAATITLTLQLIETATDLAADRFVIQSGDDDERRLLGVGHALLLARAIVIALALWMAAPLAARFFHLPETIWAFRMAAAALLIKGFSHLDNKRAQKRLDNRAAMWIEVAPQLGALTLTWPVVALCADYSAVVWLTVAQALMGVAIGHVAATTRWTAKDDAGKDAASHET